MLSSASARPLKRGPAQKAIRIISNPVSNADQSPQLLGRFISKFYPCPPKQVVIFLQAASYPLSEQEDVNGSGEGIVGVCTVNSKGNCQPGDQSETLPRKQSD
ncbi:protein POF1B [Platysternon megacephalum]|uniref:Protein POF1B n=1 Tax=Platysternon megacephalum TaxID=55544 RepID=A0A4D9EFY7_9SAUR|nr:protein POF1B [Platysternon megacephalum]